MLEIEQKFADGDFTAIERQLAAWGVQDHTEREEVDHYFNAPDRDFRQTGEAFRMRRVGAANFLTYKGARVDQALKIRPELEIPLLDGDEAAEEMLRLLGHLGYQAVGVVRKRRRSYHLERRNYSLTICLDEVAEVGRFVEVEVLAEENNMGTARAVLLEMAKELGLTQVEQRSYLGLYLARQGISAP